MSISPTSGLATFLSNQKSEFLQQVKAGGDLSSWVIATGNEAGDLDSLISAVAFSYLSSLLSTASANQVPLILTASSDVYLRPENLHALSSAGIDPASLLCIDEVSPEVLQRSPSQGGPRYALVDHNVLLPLFRPNAEQAEGAEDKVVAILDHHADEQRHLDASPRTIKVIGSCASLVVEHFSALLPPSTQLPSALADLLLSAILIDTGLKPTTTGGKATPTDLTAVQYLLPFSSFRSSSTLPSSFTAAEPVAASDLFAPLLAVNKILGDKKFDVAHLSGRDLLRRDYKEYISSPSEGGWRYGLSTVPLPLSTWLAKEREGLKGWELVEQDVEAWMRERRLNFAAVLTSFQSAMETSVKKGGAGKHQRELLLHIGAGEGSKKLEGLFDGLEKDETLQLGRWRGGDVPNVVGGKWKVWQQGNAKATRKQVAPVVKAILHAL